MSKEIQEANKFYLDFNNSNVAENLTQKEMQAASNKKCSKEMQILSEKK